MSYTDKTRWDPLMFLLGNKERDFAQRALKG